MIQQPPSRFSPDVLFERDAPATMPLATVAEVAAEAEVEALQSQHPEAQAAIIELENALARIFGQGVDSLVAEALAAVKSMQSHLGTPSFGAKLTEVKSLIGRIQNTQTERTGHVISAQLEIQEAIIALEYEHASSMKGFEFIDKRAFFTMSRVFEDMSRASRALAALEVHNNPQGELAKSLHVVALASPERVQEMKVGYTEMRKELKRLSADIHCSEDKAFIDGLIQDSNFVRVLSSNQSEALLLLQAANNEIDEVKKAAAIKAVRAHFEPELQQGRADVLLQAKTTVSNIQNADNHFTLDDARVNRIYENYKVNLRNLDEDQAMVLVGQARRDSRDILRAYAKEHKLSLNELTEKAFTEPEFFKTLSVEVQDAAVVRVVARSTQDMRMISYISEVLLHDPKQREEIIQEVRDNPDRLLDSFAQASGISEEDAKLYGDILKTAHPDDRQKLVEAILDKKTGEAVKIFDEIARKSDFKEAYFITEIDADEPSPEAPQMCTIPPHVRDQVGTIPGLNLGQKVPPTNFSPAHTPAPLAFSALSPQKDLSNLLSPS